MIRIKDNLIHLQTKNTSYVMYADEARILNHLYYGKRISLRGDCLEALAPGVLNENGSSIIADSYKAPAVCLDDICQEMSGRGKGDMREPLVLLTYPDGSTTSDFRYASAAASEVLSNPEGFPGAYGENAEELKITLIDRNSDVCLELIYQVYEDCDCIVRYSRLVNNGAAPVTVNRLMSAQLDLEAFSLKVTSFHGDWAREMNRTDTLLTAGKYVNDSSTGFSSNKANPFIMAGGPETGENYGECYAFNLLYSGNHREYAEIGSHGRSRILTGMNPDFFSWKLESGESFASPEAVLTFSEAGYEDISRHMHRFVKEHIVRGTWKKKERPILLNSWEAMYFNIHEKSLLNLASKAAKAGMELFVLDDGWFGKRNDDKSSLGDWTDNLDKLPDGLAGISKKIRAMGLMFGIWVEPEMISEDSDLYRAHPDWAVKIPGKVHAEGRHQMVLDLTRTEVQDYIIEAMSDVFTRGEVTYVKWDMNRHMSDYFSQALPPERQGEFSVRYIKGLYSVLGELTKRFPEILFEACASGGNRFDLGMLCYMPQIWASDCTDPIVRCEIQNGYSYGYPQSVMGAHVSSSPNHQTLRCTPIETRFAAACGGVLGYECNLSDAKPDDLAEIKEEVSIYKRWRKALQFGDFYRLPAQIPTDKIRWMIVSEDKREAAAIVVKNLCMPNFAHNSFRAKGLDPKAMYHFYNRERKYDIHRMGDLINTSVPIHIKQGSLLHNAAAKVYKLDGETENVTVKGSLLMNSGIHLSDSFAGTGLASGTAICQDFDARLYFLKKM